MIPCVYCEKTHRDTDGIEKCRIRKERRELRQEKKEADEKRRQHNNDVLPWFHKIRKEVGSGTSSDKVRDYLNREYPRPTQLEWPPKTRRACTGEKWTTVDVIQIYAAQLNWPI